MKIRFSQFESYLQYPMISEQRLRIEVVGSDRSGLFKFHNMMSFYGIQ